MMVRVPVVASGAATTFTLALRFVLESVVVVRPVPLKVNTGEVATVAPAAKLLPWTVMVVVPPWPSLAGLTPLMLGAGLTLKALLTLYRPPSGPRIVTVRRALAGASLSNVTGALMVVPSALTVAAPMVWSGDTGPVGSVGSDRSWMPICEPWRMPWPVIVRMRLVAPWPMLLGETPAAANLGSHSSPAAPVCGFGVAAASLTTLVFVTLTRCLPGVKLSFVTTTSAYIRPLLA